MRKEIVTTVCDNKNNNQLYLPRVDTSQFREESVALLQIITVKFKTAKKYYNMQQVKNRVRSKLSTNELQTYLCNKNDADSK